jgi:hypothetical protein
VQVQKTPRCRQRQANTARQTNADCSADGSVHASRRSVLARLLPLAPLATATAAAAPPPAAALELADVTPAVAPAQPLRAAEQAIIDVFERNTRSVANIFDLSLQGRTAQTQAVDVPEGNGSGFVWGEEGYVVTNYHVLGNVLRNTSPAALKSGEAKARRPPLAACCAAAGASAALPCASAECTRASVLAQWHARVEPHPDELARSQQVATASRAAPESKLP